MELYKNFIAVTSQFPMCGNCFRLDSYKGCSFGCVYCFANARKAGGYQIKYQIAHVKLFSKYLYEALILGEKSNLVKELLNIKVPLHLGGMSDPFQKAEWKFGITKKFLKLSNKYQYPINISTKCGELPYDYWKLLDPNIHTFSISLIGYSDEYIRKFEKRTPLSSERIKFVKELHDRGFWVSIRIQPIIDMNEVLLLIKNTEKYVDYYTVEHLKLPVDNRDLFNELLPMVKQYRMNLQARGREFEFDSRIKVENIHRIKSFTKVPIGCGDNELHIMSDSLNCCGVDTMPQAFKNWLKYNSMYIKMTGDRSQFCPDNNCSQCFMSGSVIKGYKYKDYTESYYKNMYGIDSQIKLFQ